MQTTCCLSLLLDHYSRNHWNQRILNASVIFTMVSLEKCPLHTAQERGYLANLLVTMVKGKDKCGDSISTMSSLESPPCKNKGYKLTNWLPRPMTPQELTQVHSALVLWVSTVGIPFNATVLRDTVSRICAPGCGSVPSFVFTYVITLQLAL